MDNSSRNFRQTDAIQLPDTLTTLSTSQTHIGVGCLDDTITIFEHQQQKINKTPILSWTGSSTGIIDLKFNENSTWVGGTFMDSTIRQWQLNSQKMKTIDTPIMTAWKMEYLGNEVVVCGDLGRIHFYDYATGEHKRKLEAGELHLTSLTKSNDEQLLAAGNSAGGCFLFKLGKKDRSTALKPHHHLLRSLSFTEDSTKLLTASDDCMLSVIDIASEKVVSVLEGHKEAVSGVSCHPEDSRVVISCSFDKSFKSWDLRMKGCTGTQNTGSQLWSCAVLGKQVLVGGDNCMLSVYGME